MFVSITLYPAPCYIYPALALFLVLNLLNSKLVSCRIPYQKEIEEEAPLTLRGQRDRYRNIKGEPEIYGSFPNPRPRPLFLWV